MSESAKSLREAFDSAKARSDALNNTMDRNTDSYREDLAAAITGFLECQEAIRTLSLFSSNEILEDINSNDLQYLLVDYFLAELLQKSYSENREDQLLQAQQAYERFLELLNSYEILALVDKKLLEQYNDNRSRFTIVSTTDPTARRNAKVTRFQQEKGLKQKLEYIKQNPRALEDDDDALRQLYLTEVQLAVHNTFQMLEMIPQEMKMLSDMRNAPPRPPQAEEDARRRGANRDGYSDKLDLPLSQLLGGGKGPLLDKKGKPLQPFVLTDQRRDLKKGVFRSGHTLPSMSIDEYLDEERKRGGIIDGGGEASGRAPEIDEDDMDRADAETMKAREWDEFTEANPKGSGNTINRG